MSQEKREPYTGNRLDTFELFKVVEGTVTYVDFNALFEKGVIINPE